METKCIIKELQDNTYPGRGIIIGTSACGAKAVIAYFIMGRSVNSRNRIFVPQDDGIRTQAHDPAKLSDPSLVIYAPVRTLGDKTIVTNGDQTDTVYEFLQRGETFEAALRTRTFEPDPPNYTPRISGILERKDGSFTYKLSILKSDNGNPDAPQKQFFEYTAQKGIGHFIHTYRCDGNPRIPSFDGEPDEIEIRETIDDFTTVIWDNLNADNKVSLFVRYIDIATGAEETRIQNKNQ
ncbi:MAG: IMP cyclohydrolase [Oscillospiraceae bacterium]